MNSLKEINKSWYFAVFVVVMYLVLWYIYPSKIIQSLGSAQNIFLKVLPIFILVFVLMALTNYFVEPKKLVKWLNKKHGWLVAIVAGIISTGPIYMWYPLLQDLQKHGIRNGLIATFLYNRAIKIPLLPLMIAYFGFSFVVILTVVMTGLSVAQGWVTEKLVG